MHRTSILSSLSLYLLSLFVGGPAVSQAGPLFSITTLGNLGSAGLPVAINGSGTAVGFYTDATGYQDPALFNGTATPLGTNGYAAGVNDSGSVIGYSYNGSSSTVTEWSGGNATSLGISGAGMAINNAGEITGGYLASSTQMHAFTQQNGVLKDIGTLGGSWSTGYAINNAGMVAGTSTLSNGHSAAFFYNGTSLRSLGTLGGSNSYGSAINQTGMIAGTSQSSAGYLNAFLWSSDIMHNLGTLGGTTSSATGVNNAGWVVGSSTTRGNLSTDGFLWMNGSMLDLNNLVAFGTGWTITGAYAINNADDILATATSGSETYAVELTPNSIGPLTVERANVPEPAALSLTGAGLILVGGIYRKRKRNAV